MSRGCTIFPHRKSDAGPEIRTQNQQSFYLSVIVSLVGLLVLMPAAPVLAQGSTHIEKDKSTSTDNATFNTNADGIIPQIGMSMAAARELMPKDGIREELVGACGIMKALTSHDNSTRVIGLNGVVVSVSRNTGTRSINNDDSDSASNTAKPKD